MNIQQFLQSKEGGARVICADRWMVWDAEYTKWVVYQKGYHKKATTVLYRGCSIGIALDVLHSGEATYDKV